MPQCFDYPKQVFNASVSNGATATVDVDVSGFTYLYVIWELLATTTATDLNTASVKPYRVDGSTLINQALPTLVSVAAASDSTNVDQQAGYDVRGILKVRIQATNNNVGAKTLVITAYRGSNT